MRLIGAECFSSCPEVGCDVDHAIGGKSFRVDGSRTKLHRAAKFI